MRLHVDQRHERVLELVRERGSLRVSELAAELGVSAVTLRRDVEALAGQGRVHRLHGAVVWPGETAVEVRERSQGAEGAVIGMIVPTTNYIFADIVRGAREAVAAQGGRLVLGVSGYVDAEDPVQAEHLLSGGAQGLLVAPSWFGGVPENGQEKWLLEHDVPAVLVERLAPPGNPAAVLDRVRTDRAHGAAVAVGHLASLGHRRITAVLQEGPHATQITAGYRAAVQALGLEVDKGAPTVREHGDYEASVDYLVDAVKKRRVTAALVHSDEDAIVLVPRLQACGIRVPDDLALIAYEDEVAGLSDVPLTAVGPPTRAVGELSAKLLLERLAERRSGREPGPRQHLDLLPELRVRSSCGGEPIAR
ncbi:MULTISPECIES: substrate-binding domain-containing protein [unclassified Streptomyces]|uniref:substrate-binding domain-containing protein n=1 Tax=unclassified Streptomyces TaxID=2593676 RepID=UPI002366A9D1|nr:MULTISPECIES: substrate-binding domain-containing protein [unclassified Streptomyces]MDF3147052.1 substrate-binding domain-containing protein [Streptomyces sp. T21Q-yed]WDF35470.1 substrate-binding domain-containing protein [Streptomyces sp. T12]